MNVATWNVEHRIGPAALLFDETAEALRARSAASPSDGNHRLLRVLRILEPTIVLGSSQSAEDIIQPLSVPVVRRRSGGGAVWLDPAAVVWFDIIIGRSDRLWSDDVGQAMWWVGEAFAQSLRALGDDLAMVHQSAMIHHPLERKVCWTGLGPGEVTHGASGPKSVGIAQKRTRNAALFQVGVLLSPCQHRLADPMGLDPSVILVSERGIGVDPQALIESAIGVLQRIT